jgi:predicted nucleic acid-binding protein
MAGSVVDLASPTTRLPSRLVLDSSIVIDWLVTVTRLSQSSTPTTAQLRASRLVGRLVSEQAAGLLTSTCVAEVFHFVVKSRYRAELPNYQADLLASYPNVRRHGWEHLYKARSDLLRQFAPGLHRVRRLMTGNRLLVLQPSDLGGIPSGRSLDEELVRAMARYELDSNDAAILIEAQRAGVTSVATADPDLHRARLDFDVYTWI